MKLKSIKKNALAVTLALGMVIPNALPALAQEAFTANSWINIDPNSGINSDLSNSLYMNSTDSIYYGASKEDIFFVLNKKKASGHKDTNADFSTQDKSTKKVAKNQEKSLKKYLVYKDIHK